MNRVVTLFGVLLAFLAIVFNVAHIVEGSSFLILAGAILLVGIGVLTGR